MYVSAQENPERKGARNAISNSLVFGCECDRCLSQASISNQNTKDVWIYRERLAGCELHWLYDRDEVPLVQGTTNLGKRSHFGTRAFP